MARGLEDGGHAWVPDLVDGANGGDLVVLPAAERPVAGKRRTLEATMGHGASPVPAGSR